MQPFDLLGAQRPVADAQHGAVQADRRCLFHGKTDGCCRRTEMARALRKSSRAIATEEQCPGRVQYIGIHNCLSVGLEAEIIQRGSRWSG